MAHLQIDLLLKETGYLPSFGGVGAGRTKIYLTNSLEEYHKDTGTLFANWLSSEANEANHIKRDTPVMCIIGNPPYAVSSTNKGDWIQNLLIDYKKDLNERKINLDDDYIKFIRYGQHYVEKNGSGVLAYISNNSFIDGITHRQMRKNILETFDKVYILDLHGNAKKKETTPEGKPDQNVFDIMQGVSINIFVKTGQKKKNQFGQIFHSEIFGKRGLKNTFLTNNEMSTIKWQKLENKEPYFFFIPKDYDLEKKYNSFINTQNLFREYVSGIQTKRDAITIKYKVDDLKDVKNTFLSDKTHEEIRSILSLPIDGRDWKIPLAIKDLKENNPKIKDILYRPFDKRFTFYTGKSKGFIAYPRHKVLRNFLNNDNIGILLPRQAITEQFGYFVTNTICDINYTGSAGQFGAGLVFPLYLYPEETNQISTENSSTKRTPNLNLKIVNKIAKKIGLEFVEDHELLKQVEHNKYFSPLDLLDYIYAVLHSPTYREKYKEFLKIDFPRVPFPITRGLNPLQIKERFWQLVQLGSELRQLHLLESDKVNDFITNYTGEGDNSITRKITKTDIGYEPHVSASTIENTSALKGKVWINDTQYFDNVPLIAWEFYIGGYQPAQKWLKDRKGRVLEYDDIFHYSKIIVSLTETHKIMQQIDAIEIE